MSQDVKTKAIQQVMTSIKNKKQKQSDQKKDAVTTVMNSIRNKDAVYRTLDKITPEETARKRLSTIYRVAERDPEAASKMYGEYNALKRDKTSRFYDPYTEATHSSVKYLKDRGYDVDNIDDNWFKKNSWYQDNLTLNDYTNSVKKPGKKASDKEKDAYEIYQLKKAYDNTKAAKKEQEDLRKYLTETATAKDRTMRDDEIIAGINWKKYPTLKKAREYAANGAPMAFTEGVGSATEDWAYGVLWAAMNNGGTGNSDADIANSYNQTGNTWARKNYQKQKRAEQTKKALDAITGIGMQPETRAAFTGKDPGKFIGKQREYAAKQILMNDPTNGWGTAEPQGRQEQFDWASYRAYKEANRQPEPEKAEKTERSALQEEMLANGMTPKGYAEEEQQESTGPRVSDLDLFKKWQKQQATGRRIGQYDDGDDPTLMSDEGLREATIRWGQEVYEADEQIREIEKLKQERSSWYPEGAIESWDNLYSELENGSFTDGENLIDYLGMSTNASRESVKARAKEFYTDKYQYLRTADDERQQATNREILFDSVFGGNAGSGAYELLTESMPEDEKELLDERLDEILMNMQNPYEDDTYYDDQILQLENQKRESRALQERAAEEAKTRAAIMQLEKNAPELDESQLPTQRNYATAGKTQGQMLFNMITGPQGEDDVDKAYWEIRRQQSVWNSMTSAEKAAMLDRIGGGTGTVNEGLAESLADTANAYGQYYSFMTPDQVKVFESYYSNGDKDSARAYLQALSPYLKAARNVYVEEHVRENAEGKYGMLYGLTTILEKPQTGLMGSVGTVLAAAGNKDAGDKNSELYLGENSVNAIRQERSEEWGEAAGNVLGEWAKEPAKFINNVLYSIADNLMAMGIASGGGLAENVSQPLVQLIMSSEAASTTMNEQLKEGRDPEEAAMYAIGSGVIEAVTEKYSLEALLNPNIKEMLGNKRQIAKFILKNFAAEGSEEGASDVLEIGMDWMLSMLNGHETELQKRYNELVAGGMSKDKATQAVFEEKMREIGIDMLAGGVSGMLMSGGRVGANAAQEKATGKTVKSAKTSGSRGQDVLVEAGLGMKEDTQSHKLAKKIQEKIESGKEASDYDVGRLASNIQVETNENIGNAARTVVEDRAYEKLNDGDLNGIDRREAARIIAKAVTGEEMTASERSTLTGNTSVFNLYKQFMTPGETGDEVVGAIMDATQKDMEAAASVSELLNQRKAQATNEEEDPGEQLASEEDIRNASGEAVTGARGVIVDGQWAKLGNLVEVKERDAEGNTKTSLRWQISGTDQTVKASQIRATDFSTAAIIRQATINPGMFSNGFVNTLMQANEQGQIKNVGRFLLDAQKVRMAGYLGMQMPANTMGSQAAQDIYNQAKYEHGKNRDAQLKDGNAGRQGKITFMGAEYGTTEWNQAIKNANLDSNQRAQIDAIAGIAQRAGIEVYFRSAEEVAKEWGTSDPEMTYGWESNTDEHGRGISVNIEGLDFALGENGTPEVRGQHNMLVTFGHEMTHWLQRNSANGYNQLESFVMGEMRRNGVNIQRRVMDVMERRGLSIEDAMSEIVADACDQILANEEVRDHIQETNQGLFKEIKHFVSDLVGRVKAAIKGMDQSASRDARAMMRSANRLAKVWLGAYDEAISGTIREGESTGSETTRMSKADEDVSEWKTYTMRGNDLIMRDGKGNETKLTGKDREYVEAWKHGDFRYMEDLLAEKIRENGAIPFKTPASYNDPDHKWVANAIKEKNTYAIKRAAAEMAQMVPDNAVLVPMPNHYGQVNEDTDTMILAQEISKITKRPVITALAGVERESRKENKSRPKSQQMKAEDLGFRQVKEIPEGTVPYIVDNVIASGLTAEAAHRALGNNGVTLAYAKSTRSANDGLKRANVTFYDKAARPKSGYMFNNTNANYGQYLIPLSERIDMSKTGYAGTKFSKAELDSEYDQAVKSGDAERQQELVDQAAEAAMPYSTIRKEDGSLRKLYHGTYSDTFTVFDKDLIGTVREGDTGFFGKGFYFTFHKGEARSYGNNVMEVFVDIRNPFNFRTELNTYNSERANIYGANHAVFAVNWARKFPQFNFEEVGVTTKDGERKAISLQQFADEFEDIYKNKEFEVRKVESDEGDYWEAVADPRTESYTNEDGETFSWTEYGFRQKFYTEADARNKTQQAYLYLANTVYDHISIPSSPAIVMSSNLTEELIKRGYDGVIQSDDGDEVVAFESSQIKLADPVTYDDNGNIIPLSERFDSSKGDIRFSKTITDEKADETLKNTGEIASAPVRYSYAGINAQGGFGAYAQEAMRMAKEGVPGEEIARKTGCVLGYNGRWWKVLDRDQMHFHINSEFAKGREVATVELGDVYDARELYEAYPRLKKALLRFIEMPDNEWGRTGRNQYSPVVEINKKLLDYDNSTEIIEGVLQHEIQHVIQSIEGTNSGSSPTFWKDMQDIAKARMHTNSRYLDEIYKKYGIDQTQELAFGIEFNEDGSLDEEWLFPEELEKVRRISEEDLESIRNIDRDSAKWQKIIQADRTPVGLYRDTVGEIEARAAEERKGKSQWYGIPYGTDAVTTEEYTGAGTRWSKYTHDNMDVEEWMSKAKPWNLVTEDERELLDKYNGLRTRRGLLTKTVLELKADIKRKESILDKLTPDELKDLERAKTKLEEKQQKLLEAEDELFRVTSTEGYAGMMYRNNVVLNDWILGKTQDDVREAVEQMVDQVKASERSIAAQVKALRKLADSQAVRAVSSMVEKKSLAYAVTSLKKQLNSDMGKTELESRLIEIALKKANGEDIQEDARLLAVDLTNKTRGYEIDTMERLRGITITIGPDQQAEMKGKGMTLQSVRDSLKGTGVKVRYGEYSSLDTDEEDLRTVLPELPQDIGENSADALFKFISWAQSMRDGDLAAKQSMVDIEEETTNVLAIASTIKVNMNSPEYRKQNEAAAKTRQAADELEQAGKAMSEQTELAGRRAIGFTSVLQRDVHQAIEYYNKVAKVAAQEEKNKVRKNLIEELKSENTRKLMEQRDKYEEMMKSDRRNRELAEDNMQIRNRINTIASRINKRLTAETDLKNIPQEAKPLARQVLKMLINHDMVYRHVLFADKKQRQATMQAMNAYDMRDGRFNPDRDLNWLIVGEGDNADYDIYDKVCQDLIDIEQGLLNYRNAEGQKGVTLMDRREALRKIDSAVSEIWSVIRAREEANFNGKRMLISEMALQARDDMAKSRFKGEWTGAIGHGIGALRSGVIYGNMTPEYFFKNLKNKTISQLYDEYHRAENRNGLEVGRAQRRIAEIAEKYGYSAWDQEKRYTFKLVKGGTVNLTLGEMMSLYATWQREEANRAEVNGPEESFHLNVGGFYTVQEEKNKILGRELFEQKAHRLTEADMNAIKARMTEEQLDYVRDVVEYITKDIGALGNEASMRMFGIKKYNEQWYFPFEIWEGVKSKKSDQGATGNTENRTGHQSFTLRRVKNASNALVIRDFTETAVKHIAGMINYNTFAPAIEFMNRVMNTQLDEFGEGEDSNTKRNLRAIIGEIYGKDAVKYLDDFQKDVNGGVTRPDSTIYDKLLSTFKKSAVAGSMSVALQQPLSYIRAAMMVSPKYLATSINLGPRLKSIAEEMRKYSGVAVIKKMGKFDMNFGRSAQDYMMPDAKVSKGRAIYDKASDIATALPELMDTWTWCNMWEAVKKEQATMNPGVDQKSDEFLEKVAERFNDVMRKTQVYDSVLVKSRNMRNTNPIMKSLTSFMSEPTLTANVLYDAVINAKEKGGKTVLAKAATTFVMSAILQAIVKGLISAGRTPQDKKTWDENVAYRVNANLLNELNPMNLLPGYNDLIVLFKEGELSDDATSVVGKLLEAGKTTISVLQGKSENPWYRDLEDTAGVVSQLFTNIPAKNIMRDIRATINYIQAPWANRANSSDVLKYQLLDQIHTADNLTGVLNTWLGDKGWEIKNAAYYDRIYAADKAGKKERVAGMIEYLTLARNTKKETINEELRGLAKKDRDLSSEEKLKKQQEYGLKDGSSWIRDEYKAGRLDRKTAEKLYREAHPKMTDKQIKASFDKIDEQKKSGK